MKQKKYDCASYFIKQGASIYLKDQVDMSPLFFAIRQGDIQTLKVILETHPGAATSYTTSSGLWLLNYAC